MHNIVRPEIIFCNKHILIIYSKTAFIKIKKEYISLDEDFSKDKFLKIEEDLDILDL